MNMIRHHHSYKIGDIALSCDINTSHDADAEAKRSVAFLKVGDPAFIRRSDKVWRFATVSEVSPATSTSNPYIVFIVTADGSTKKVGMHHWGDRVRTLKKRRSVTKYLSQKGLRSSAETSPADSQSSSDLEYTASRAQVDRSSDDGSHTTDNEPQVPTRHGHGRGLSARRIHRRESLKDKFIRKVSGGKTREVNRLESDITKALDELDQDEIDDDYAPHPAADSESQRNSQVEPNSRPSRRMQRRGSLKDMFVGKVSRGSSIAKDLDDMKVHEFNETAPSPVCVKSSQDLDVKVEKDIPMPIQRKPNSRHDRDNTLTTSALFKNLMMGAIDDKDSPAESSTARRKTVADMTADDDNDDIAPLPQGGTSSRLKRRPARRTRRATVDTGKPSAEMVAELRSKHHRPSGNEKPKAHSNESSPTASLVMRGAFAQLLEEKCKLSPKDEKDKFNADDTAPLPRIGSSKGLTKSKSRRNRRATVDTAARPTSDDIMMKGLRRSHGPAVPTS